MTALSADVPVTPFAHHAFLYESPTEHLERCSAFIEEGLDLGEPVLVAVPSCRLAPLRERFAGAGDQLRFEDMEVMGRNPAWIIPEWAAFAGPHVLVDQPARGIGEPIWPSRTPDQLVECARHESLLNLAFADAFGFTLLCPYDVDGLDDDVLAGARHNHPVIHDGRGTSTSAHYDGHILAALRTPLPPPPPGVASMRFDLGRLPELRDRVRALAAEAGLAGHRIEDLAVAVTEAATNSIRHAGGHGTIACWHDGGRVVCEVRDAGAIDDPLAGRCRPPLDRHGGRGLWLIHQLADLVQHRVTDDGQVLRIHMG